MKHKYLGEMSVEEGKMDENDQDTKEKSQSPKAAYWFR